MTIAIRSPKYYTDAVSNYSRIEWSNYRKACRYARGTADATNPVSQVCDLRTGACMASWRYTPDSGGRTFRATI